MSRRRENQLSSWEQGASASTCIVVMYLIGTSSIGLLSLKYGESSWTRLDVVCGILGVVSLVLLFLAHAPFWALLLAITCDGIAGIPTVVAVTKNPGTESRAGWTIFFLGAFLNLFAIKTWNFQEAGYTIYLLAIIGYICAHLWFRRPPQAAPSVPQSDSTAREPMRTAPAASRETVASR